MHLFAADMVTDPLLKLFDGCDENTLMICNGDEPVAIAGIMGGLNSGIKDCTKEVVFESAKFARDNVRKTSRALGQSSDSSSRFEKGVDEYFDREFYNFYKNDIANGVSEDEIRTDLAYFLLQFTSIDNYWNQPVYLGGENSDGSTVINELSYLFLDVYDKLNIYSPKIQIKFSNSIISCSAC